MEFDKLRVFSAVNADELPIGSKCIFADNMYFLRKHVEENSGCSILISVLPAAETKRFCTNYENTIEKWQFAYIIEPSDKSKYQPFESIENVMTAIRKHGGWIADNEGFFNIMGVSSDTDGLFYKILILLGDRDWYSAEELLDRFSFADDGSPCGELVEE